MWQWRIELYGLTPDAAPLGYDIVGNVIIGRSVDGSEADIDLEPYNALAKGVSRQHAMIRPTKQRLFLIDLSSTNGVRHNEVPTGPGLAVTLRNGDVVTLGDLTFEIRIIDQPGPDDEDDQTALRRAGTKPLPDRS
jgi:pSer/pThr/pTyr-binding forkhead associated (FHA) protein